MGFKKINVTLTVIFSITMIFFRIRRHFCIVILYFCGAFCQQQDKKHINKADIMKIKSFLLTISLLALFSCTNKHKSEEIASYSYSADVKLSKVLQDRIGSWIEEGVECYSFIVMYNDNGKIVSAKPIKAKALVITEKAIKMKALETVSLAPKIGCTKLGLEKGDTWWENNGDLFQTKEEALAYLKTTIESQEIKTDRSF